jgi:hypothetical protein
MRLSISSALLETFILWKKHLGFFLLLSFFLHFPDAIFTHVASRSAFTLWNVLNGAARQVSSVIFQAAGMAATLSLFHVSPAEADWLVMVRSVQRHTGSLVGVQLFIILIVFAVTLPLFYLFTLIHPFSAGWTTLVVALGYLLLLALLKYALADPLVVAEDLKAIPALSMSWQMTKRRFGYVFGCYFLLALAIGVVNALAWHGATWLGAPVWISPLLRAFSEFIGTLWFVLPWIMYLQIKATDEFVSSSKPPRSPFKRSPHAIGGL